MISVVLRGRDRSVSCSGLSSICCHWKSLAYGIFHISDSVREEQTGDKLKHTARNFKLSVKQSQLNPDASTWPTSTTYSWSLIRITTQQVSPCGGDRLRKTSKGLRLRRLLSTLHHKYNMITVMWGHCRPVPSLTSCLWLAALIKCWMKDFDEDDALCDVLNLLAGSTLRSCEQKLRQNSSTMSFSWEPVS